ncbi:MAG: hypothetical protein LBF62_03930 [Tannerellaceae bacterium]|jgi:hypothetical protein|nr:hypothetical protein [Tannerellaceae bacterium]
MKRFIVMALMMIPLSGFAQITERYRNEVQLTSGFNTQAAFEMEIAYSFFLTPYAGITLGLNAMDQYFNRMFCNGDDEERSLLQTLFCGTCDGYDLWLHREEYKRQYANALLARPAVCLRLPLLREAGEDALVFNMESGLFLSLIPNERLTVRNKGGRWLYYHLKGYLSIDLDQFRFSAGYSFSDFDIFDSRRSIFLDKTAPQGVIRDRKKTSTVFLALAYRF